MAALSPGELKSEDQFISFWRRAYNLYRAHEKQVLAGLVAALLILAGIWGWSTFQDWRERTAWSEYESILLSLNKDKTDAAKAEAAKAEATKELNDLLARRGSSKAAQQARLELAALAAAKADYEGAVKSYLAFLDNLHRDDPLRSAVADALGHCFESLGKLDEAARWYEAVTQAAHLADLGLWNLGRVQELAGQKDKAVATYRQLLEKHPTSVYVSPVHDRLADLEG